MSSSSPFRTEKNHTYRWPPEPFEGDYVEYARVTKLIGEGEPKEWMRNYVASTISEVLTQRAGDILGYLARSHDEKPEQFSLDQEWWNEILNEAYQKDLNQAQKRQMWDDGELPYLKTRPCNPYLVKAKLKLSPPEKFKKWLKAAPDIYRDNAANLGTTVHKIAEDMAQHRTYSWEPRIAGWVKHAELFLTRYKPQFIEIESVVYSDTYRYAGQFDWLARIPISVMKTLQVYNRATKKYEPWTDKRSPERKAAEPDHIVVWGDYKTGTRGIKDSIALQLSAYYFAEWIGRADGSKDPIPEVDEFWGVSIREDALEVIPVTVNETTFASFRDVIKVGKWMTEVRKTVLNKPLLEIDA